MLCANVYICILCVYVYRVSVCVHAYVRFFFFSFFFIVNTFVFIFMYTYNKLLKMIITRGVSSPSSSYFLSFEHAVQTILRHSTSHQKLNGVWNIGLSSLRERGIVRSNNRACPCLLFSFSVFFCFCFAFLFFRSIFLFSFSRFSLCCIDIDKSNDVE